MEEIWAYAPDDAKVYLTDANHPDFVKRYLNNGRYIKDVQNFGIAHEMVTDIKDIRNWVKGQMEVLPPYLKRIGSDIPKYPVYTVKSLRDIQHGLEDAWVKEYDKNKAQKSKAKTLKEIMEVVEKRLIYNMGSNVE